MASGLIDFFYTDMFWDLSSSIKIRRNFRPHFKRKNSYAYNMHGYFFPRGEWWLCLPKEGEGIKGESVWKFCDVNLEGLNFRWVGGTPLSSSLIRTGIRNVDIIHTFLIRRTYIFSWFSVFSTVSYIICHVWSFK